MNIILFTLAFLDARTEIITTDEPYEEFLPGFFRRVSNRHFFPHANPYAEYVFKMEMVGKDRVLRLHIHYIQDVGDKWWSANKGDINRTEEDGGCDLIVLNMKGEK